MLSLVALIGAILFLSSLWYWIISKADHDSGIEDMAIETVMNWIALIGVLLLIISTWVYIKFVL